MADSARQGVVEELTLDVLAGLAQLNWAGHLTSVIEVFFLHNPLMGYAFAIDPRSRHAPIFYIWLLEAAGIETYGHFIYQHYCCFFVSTKDAVEAARILLGNGAVPG